MSSKLINFFNLRTIMSGLSISYCNTTLSLRFQEHFCIGKTEVVWVNGFYFINGFSNRKLNSSNKASAFGLANIKNPITPAIPIHGTGFPGERINPTKGRSAPFPTVGKTLTVIPDWDLTWGLTWGYDWACDGTWTQRLLLTSCLHNA